MNDNLVTNVLFSAKTETDNNVKRQKYLKMNNNIDILITNI